MSKQFVLLILFALASISLYYSIEENGIDAFEQWKKDFGVFWKPEEQAYRRIIFENNLVRINQHNADSSKTYKMQVNQFAVFTQKEFEHRFLSHVGIQPTEQISVEMNRNDIDDIDWVARGAVSQVKSQGNCNAGWAFATTGALESWSRIKKGIQTDLSEQQLIDCSRPQGDLACYGGTITNSFGYVVRYGLTTEKDYPYMGKEQACKKNGGTFRITGESSYNNCNGLWDALEIEPVAVAVDARNWAFYKSGVFWDCDYTINHAVLLVGLISGNWKIQNSWGINWGNRGYITIGTGNTCGICLTPGVIPL